MFTLEFTRGIRRKGSVPGTAPAQAPPAPASPLMRFLSAGLRIGSGALASIPALEPGLGSAIGAGIAGAGESGAEWLEGSEQSPWRIGTEAALGATPGGWYFKAARPWASALKGGAMTGAGEAMREYAQGGARNMDVGNIALAAGLGGLFGKVLAGHGMPKEEVLPTNQGTSRLISHGRPIKEGPRAGQSFPVGETIASRDLPFKDTTTHIGRDMATGIADATSRSAFGRLVTPSIERNRDTISAIDKGIQSAGKEGTGIRNQVAKDIVGEERAHETANKMADQMRRTEGAAWKARRAEQEIATARAQVEPTVGDVSERVSAETPSGREGFTRTWKPEDLEPTADTLGGPIGKGPTLTPKQQTDSFVEKLFKLHLDSGKNPVNSLKLARKGISPDDLLDASTNWENLVPEPRVQDANPFANHDLVQTADGSFHISGPEGRIVEGPFANEQEAFDALSRRGSVPPEAPPPAPAPPPRVPPRGGPPSTPPPTAAPPPRPTTAELDARAFYGADTPAAPPTTPSPTVPEPTKTRRYPGQETWPDEVTAEMDRLGDAYRSAPAGERSGSGSPGAQISELRDFMTPNPKMRESWRGAEPVAPPTAAQQELIPAVTGAVPSAEEDITLLKQLKDAGVSIADMSEEELQTTLDELRKGKQNFLNRLGKPPGGTTLGAGLGGAQNIADLIQKYPQLALKLGLGAAGAAAGGVVDPLDNPMASAALGGAAGYNITNIPAILRSLGAPAHVMNTLQERLATPEGIRQTASEVVKALPQLQRTMLLADRAGLLANAAVGPWGSGMVFAIERGLSGDPRGWALARRLINPVEFIGRLTRHMESGAAEALIQSGDMGRAETSALDWLGSRQPRVRQVVQAPGMAMTAGDMSVRDIIEDVGFAEHEARRATMTNEPELSAPKALTDLTKRSPLLQALMPFSRTLANIGEQGALSFPGLGAYLQAGRDVPDTAAQQVIQQLVMTPAATAAGYLAGSNMDPNTQASRTINKFLTNAAGRYSLAAGGGFAAGQAKQAGRPITTTGLVDAFSGALPLPSTAPVTDTLRYFGGGMQGKDIPRGFMPRELKEYLFPAATKMYRLGSIRRRRQTATGR